MEHLLENEVHHINGCSISLWSSIEGLVSMVQEVGKPTPDSIIISSTWSNSVTENPQHKVVEGLESLGTPHNTIIIQRCQLHLVLPQSCRVHAQPHMSRYTMKGLKDDI